MKRDRGDARGGFREDSIYEERVDNLNVGEPCFDLLRATSEDYTIDRFIRTPYYVPKQCRLLINPKLQRHHTQIAVVVKNMEEP